MAIETTPLGFQKPDGDEALRNGDNVISANAQKSEDESQSARGRLGLIEQKNTAQDGRLDKVEAKDATQDANIANLLNAAGFTGDPLALNDAAFAETLTNGTATSAALDVRLTARVPPIVAAAIASNPTVASSAATMAQNTAGLVPVWKATTAYVAGQRAIAPNGDVVSAKVNFTSGAAYDPANWNASTQDGRIGAVETVNTAQTARVDDLVASGLGTGWTVLSNDVVAWAVVDASRRRSDLEIAKDGKLTQRVVDSLKARMGVGVLPETLVPEVSAGKVYLNTPSTGGRVLLGTIAGASNPSLLDPNTVRVDTPSGPQWINAATGAARPVFPTLNWTAWGDSLTYSQATGQANPTWPQIVATNLGVPVYNGGRQGQASAEIATRQGGLRPLLAVTGDSIPASGSVGVTVVSPTDGWRPSGTSLLAMEGTLAGIPGTLYHDAATQVWTFTRAAAGSATACPASTPFIGTEGDDKRADNVIIWAGTNNNTQQTAILRDIASMVAWLTPYDKRYLVIGLTTPGNDAVNAALAAAYGSRFEDLRSYMISSGLSAAGITPTTDDTAAIAANNIPPSLMTDATHFNQAGYNVIGARIAARIRARNWN